MVFIGKKIIINLSSRKINGLSSYILQTWRLCYFALIALLYTQLHADRNEDLVAPSICIKVKPFWPRANTSFLKTSVFQNTKIKDLKSLDFFQMWKIVFLKKGEIWDFFFHYEQFFKTRNYRWRLPSNKSLTEKIFYNDTFFLQWQLKSVQRCSRIVCCYCFGKKCEFSCRWCT